MTINTRVALVTGANQGIGSAIAFQLITEGYHVVLVGRDPDKLKNICQKSTHFTSLTCDLSQTQEIAGLIPKIKNAFGRLDVLINNAGLLIEEDILNADLDAWDQALDVNLRACMHLTKHALPLLKDAKGAIINIGSTAGFRAYKKGANYCATKYGLRGFTQAVFEDVRNFGIKVCLIEPGHVNTLMHDSIKENLEKEKMLQPEDIASTVSFVLSTPSRVCPTEIVLMPQVDPRSHRR